MKHTKGPWKCSSVMNFSDTLVSYISNKNKNVAQLRGCETGEEDEAEANAKLISKAPEMHEALKMVALCSNYEESKKMLGNSPKHWTRKLESLLKELE